MVLRDVCCRSCGGDGGKCVLVPCLGNLATSYWLANAHSHGRVGESCTYSRGLSLQRVSAYDCFLFETQSVCLHQCESVFPHVYVGALLLKVQFVIFRSVSIPIIIM